MMKKWLILLGLTCWGLTSCQPASISPAPIVIVMSSTNTPQPTNTFLSTSTLTPTFTTVPSTPTIAPPDVLTKYLENVRIVKTDSFDKSSGWSSPDKISNGVMKIVGDGAWGGASPNASFSEDKGVIINFKFTQGESTVMFLENGAWNTNSYKRFGVQLNGGNADANLFTGTDRVGVNHLSGNLYPKPDTWYSLCMVSGKGGDFFALVWDPANPEKVIKYRDKVEKWKGLSWTFYIQVNEGTVEFDDFAEIAFDDIK